jgi:hypothetical protein
MNKVQFVIEFDLNCVSIIARIITTCRNFFYETFLATRRTYSWTFRYWPGHLGTRYWTVRDLDETIFLTDHNCLILINCQYFCIIYFSSWKFTLRVKIWPLMWIMTIKVENLPFKWENLPFQHKCYKSYLKTITKFVSDLRQASGFLWILHFPRSIKLKYCWKWHFDLQQVSGFLWALWFPPPIKLTTTI